MSMWDVLLNSWGSPRAEREVQLGRDEQAANFYDIPPDLINQLKRNPYQPFYIQSLNLTVAQNQALEVPVVGTSVVIRGNDGSANKAVNTTVLVNCQFERNDNSGLYYPLKHNFGFCGIFTKLYLTWPAQSGCYADLIIYKGLFRPWIDGSAAT